MLNKICVILRQFAKNSFTPKMFEPVGMDSVLTILQNIIPHVCRSVHLLLHCFYHQDINMFLSFIDLDIKFVTQFRLNYQLLLKVV